MIVSTPLILPPLVPASWDTWWTIWENHATPLKKKLITPNRETGNWIGFDVIRSPSFFPAYPANFVDLNLHDPGLLKQIESIPVTIKCARFIMAKGNFLPHVDFLKPAWAIRSMFFCEDPEQQWYYTDLSGNNIQHLKLPPTTNWWAYRDGLIKHGTTYNEKYPKIILQIFSDDKLVDQLVNRSISHFNEYTIKYDID